MKKTYGRVTLPMDKDIKVTKDVLDKWGADAIRDCDGTTINQDIIDLGKKVYKTYFVTRGDNEWAKANTDEFQHFYIMSKPKVAVANTLVIDLLEGYLDSQITPDFTVDINKYWQVIDRTTNEIITKYEISEKNKTLTINNANKFHTYTVSFLATVLWDSTQMYNYITNNWDREKEIPYDPRYTKTGEYIKDHLKEWLKDNKGVNVVRFTTFLYHFTLLFNNNKKEKYVDWFGYTETVSVKALEDFEKEYGYTLTPEDFVDNGYYNNPFRIPSKAFLDYMEFIQKFVSKKCRELVDIVHKENREAMMFLGDTWIGTEPYGKYFKSIGLDSVVGSVGGGVTVRMLTDIEGVNYVEGRFLPYFFPDTFYKGNDPTIELNKNWLTARRAMMRKPLDRIGYGGYLSLANQFPDFIDRVSEITEEFRNLYENIHNVKPYAEINVAVLNAWGKIRSWQSFMVAHELWYQQIYSYQGILESLSGLPVNVSFISFDDIISNGVHKDINVIINAGSVGTAFSGGEYWKNPLLNERIREFVYNGGGFIGIGEPTACEYGGKYFQLGDIMGVQKEMSFSLSEDKYNINFNKHFITEDVLEEIDYGEGTKNIYAYENSTVIDIDINDCYSRKVNIGEVKLCANSFGKGNGVYIAGLPFSFQNSRILLRAMYFACNKQDKLKKAYAEDIFVECHYYPEKDFYALVNNTEKEITTDFYNIEGKKSSIKLNPMEIKWIKE